MMEWKEELQQHTKEAEKVVQGYLPEETGHQKLLIEASNYSVLVGGKRLRPMIMLESFKAFGGTGNVVEPFMAALEMIHSGSLLQSLSTVRGNQRVTSDNPEATYDTLEKYGYDMAVLAGDKLFIYAFETAAKAFALTDRADLVGKAISILANKAGIYGMIGGQSVDVEYTDRPVTKSQLEFIYELKTAALLEAAMMIGAVLAGADDNQVKSAEQIAHHVGMAFQIRDDILDVISTTEELGKPVKSDEKNNKTTYVTIYGIDGASKLVEEYSHTAMTLLDQVCPNASFLKRIFEYLIVRKK